MFQPVSLLHVTLPRFFSKNHPTSLGKNIYIPKPNPNSKCVKVDWLIGWSIDWLIDLLHKTVGSLKLPKNFNFLEKKHRPFPLIPIRNPKNLNPISNVSTPPESIWFNEFHPENPQKKTASIMVTPQKTSTPGRWRNNGRNPQLPTLLHMICCKRLTFLPQGRQTQQTRQRKQTLHHLGRLNLHTHSIHMSRCRCKWSPANGCHPITDMFPQI